MKTQFVLKKIIVFLTCCLLSLLISPELLYAATPSTTDIGAYSDSSLVIGKNNIENAIVENYNGTNYGEDNSKTIYVDPDGDDAVGDGTKTSPYKSIVKATVQANIHKPCTIQLSEGEYVLTNPIILEPGVSLEGDSANNTIISVDTSNLGVFTDENDRGMLELISEEITSEETRVYGNQHLSNLTIDGCNSPSDNIQGAARAVTILNRSNVAIHDCNIKNCVWNGVFWGTNWDENGLGDVGPNAFYPPNYWCTGCRFFNNKMNNCAGYDGHGRGALFCSGLQDFRIYNNEIIETCSVGDTRGVPVKFWAFTGWMIGCKIHNNTIGRYGSQNENWDEDSMGWDFAIESMYHSGLEICNNTFVGAVDVNNGLVGTYGGVNYSYSSKIHDNDFLTDENKGGNDAYEKYAIALESAHTNAIIERNYIDGYHYALFFNMRTLNKNIIFRNNLCVNMGGGDGPQPAIFLSGATDDNSSNTHFTVDGLYIINNTMMARKTHPDSMGIILGAVMDEFDGTWEGRNIEISNNIFTGFEYNWLSVQCCTNLSDMNVENNIYYGNGGWNPIAGDNSAFDGHIYADVMTNVIKTDNIDPIEDGIYSSVDDANEAIFIGNVLEEPEDYKLNLNSIAVDAGKALNFDDQEEMTTTSTVEETTTENEETTVIKYVISIDGNEYFVNDGDEFQFPSINENGYITTDYSTIYAPGQLITVNDNLNVNSVGEIELTMLQGASIKLDGTHGIRFSTSVDCEDINMLNSSNIEFGTFFTAYDMYTECYKELLDFNIYNSWLNEEKKQGYILNVVNDGWLEGKTGNFSAGITNMLIGNWERYFIARSYMIIKYQNGDNKIIYSEMSPIRSIISVAKAIKNAGYPGLTDEQKNIIDNYVSQE